MPGMNSYPIVSFTYILVYKELSILSDMTLQKATALVNFLWFLVHDAQTLGGALGYPQLSVQAIAVDEASLRSMTFNGQLLHA